MCILAENGSLLLVEDERNSGQYQMKEVYAEIM